MKLTRTFIFIVGLLVLYDLNENIVFPLTVQLLENAICQKHFYSITPEHGPVHEPECKTTAIQSKLAFIRGWYSLFRTLPAIAAGPYFGGLADRWGRRPVYAISLAGLSLQLAVLFVVCYDWITFPIQLSWASAVLVAFGGGQFVIIGLNFTMVTDVSGADDSSQYLYAAFAIRFVADLISPQVASSALEHSLWLPTLVAQLCLVASFGILLLMEEPLHIKAKANRSNVEEDKPLPTSDILKRLLTDWKVLLGMVVTFLLQFRYMTQSILISYASVRFGWTIAQFSRLLSVIPAVSLVLFLGLPFLQQALKKRLSEQWQSFWLLNLLTLALIVGDALMAAASTMPFLVVGLAVFAIGEGVRAPLLTLASTYLDSHYETASLYTLLSITDAFAHTIGDPLLQTVWKRALNLGGQWLILPLVTSLSCFILAMLTLWFLPVLGDPARDIVSEVDGEDRPLLSS